jgi:hypothetical protein
VERYPKPINIGKGYDTSIILLPCFDERFKEDKRGCDALERYRNVQWAPHMVHMLLGFVPSV